VKLKVGWRELPLEVRGHLAERMKDRSIGADDLYKLQVWIESDPDVPDGNWYRDFGTFKLAGRGSLVLTFLTSEQIGYGEEIAD
jgi:hypothetical protein